uniref:Uncharacterized protein n=1 Tax=Tanacetum cinerariifolium TaxID=118510 RepID=A0A6L2JVX3_TANCI|nr:hypothetical protein [Tanacetum cinerariifolium]
MGALDFLEGRLRCLLLEGVGSVVACEDCVCGCSCCGIVVGFVVNFGIPCLAIVVVVLLLMLLGSRRREPELVRKTVTSLSTLLFLKIPENSFEVLKILENRLKVLKVLENNLDSMKLQKNCRDRGGKYDDPMGENEPSPQPKFVLYKDPSVSASSELFALASGPTPTPILVNSCIVNGVRFVVHSRDERRTIQNIDICSPGEDREMYYEDDPDIIHVNNSSDLALTTSLDDLEITDLHIDGQSINVDAPPDIIDMSADVGRDHDGDGDDRPPSHQLAGGCQSSGNGTRKPNLRGRKAGRMHTRKETRNIGLRKITDELGPIPPERKARVLEKIEMQSFATQEYPSLIQTFFDTHNVGGVFLRDEDRRLYEEMLRLQGLGTYIDDQIMAMVRRGKQRGHIFGVGRVLAGRVKDVLDVPVPRYNHTSDVSKLKRSNKQLQKQIDMIMKAISSDDKLSSCLRSFSRNMRAGVAAVVARAGMMSGTMMRTPTRMRRMQIVRRCYIWNMLSRPHDVAGENWRGMYPLPAFLDIFSPPTCRRGILSPGTCRRGKGVYVSEDSGKSLQHLPLSPATNSSFAGRLVVGDTYLGRHVARDNSIEKARRGYVPGRLTRATSPGPHSFSQTIKCHNRGFSGIVLVTTILINTELD